MDDLLGQFRRQVSLPWSQDTARDYRVWIMHYDRTLERRVQGRLHEFEALAREFHHGWASLNLATLIAPWFAGHDLFNGLCEQPDELPGLLPDLESHIIDNVRARLRTLHEQDSTAAMSTWREVVAAARKSLWRRPLALLARQCDDAFRPSKRARNPPKRPILGESDSVLPVTALSV